MAHDKDSPSAFADVKWEDHSSVEIGYQVAPVGPAGRGNLLRVSFSGDYGIGSDGNRDATYMDAMVRAACEVIRPDGVVLDFSTLTYQWGDLLGKAIGVPERWEDLKEPPFAIVEGPGCSAALRSLLTEELGWDVNSLDWVFGTIEEARAFVELRIGKNALATQQRFDDERHESALAFWTLLGDEIGPECCRTVGCMRLRIKDSVLCRIHHFEQVKHATCPFS